jgi:hypothetical protein
MKRLAALSLAAMLAGSAAAALAQDAPAGGGRIRQACAADMAKICPDAQPGPGRRQCVMEHREQFSDACKAAIAEVMARRRANQPAAPQTN